MASLCLHCRSLKRHVFLWLRDVPPESNFSPCYAPSCPVLACFCVHKYMCEGVMLHSFLSNYLTCCFQKNWDNKKCLAIGAGWKLYDLYVIFMDVPNSVLRCCAQLHTRDIVVAHAHLLCLHSTWQWPILSKVTKCDHNYQACIWWETMMVNLKQEKWTHNHNYTLHHEISTCRH